MKQREGYLLVDHQASPGLPEWAARLAGYDPLQCKEGKQFEAGTLTCAHCKVTVIKSPLRQRPRELCQKCSGKYICDGCAYIARQPDYLHTSYEEYSDVSLELGARGTVLGSIEQLIFGHPLPLRPATPTERN